MVAAKAVRWEGSYLHTRAPAVRGLETRHSGLGRTRAVKVAAIVRNRSDRGRHALAGRRGRGRSRPDYRISVRRG